MSLTVKTFAKPLETSLSRAMHVERKRVFRDTMRWDVALVSDTYEIDQFDDEHALYFIRVSDSGEHLGSFRLLPTIRPHMVSEVFPHLCDGDIPADDNIMEITRACVTPKVTAIERLRIRNQLISACVDYARDHGIHTYTCVVSSGFLAQILAMGWEVEPLGLPRRIDGVLTAALRITVDHTTPRRLSLTGIYAPSTISTTPVVELAA